VKRSHEKQEEDRKQLAVVSVVYHLFNPYRLTKQADEDGGR